VALLEGPLIVIILKLVAGLRCQGCGSCHRLVSKKSHLCLFCMGFRLDVETRKKKLETTLSQRFAVIQHGGVP
jgi:hypothetical protein